MHQVSLGWNPLDIPKVKVQRPNLIQVKVSKMEASSTRDTSHVPPALSLEGEGTCTAPVASVTSETRCQAWPLCLPLFGSDLA